MPRSVPGCVLALAAAFLLFLVPAAQAAEVALDGDSVTVQAAPGEANRVVLTTTADGVSVQDTGAPIVAGDGCAPAGAGKVACAAAALQRATVDLGDGNDTFSLSGGLAATVADGPGNDAVTGGAGDDVFLTGTGADAYMGGAGADTADYSGRAARLVLDLDGVADDGAVGEADNVRADVERVLGGAGDDALTGSSSANVLEGRAGDDRLDGAGGDDTLDGGEGDDTLLGGSGVDTADYTSRTSAIAADLDAGSGGEQGEDDAYDGVESVAGGSGADVLRGDAAANSLAGGAGDDVLDGRSGRDVLDGGPGVDTIDYSARTSGVTVDLDGNADDGAYGERDTVRPGAERLLGGSGDDSLTGGDGAETLSGGDGADMLDGNGGDDVLDAGTGDDRLYGDAGDDVLDAGTGDDRLYGDAGADQLAAGDGADQLYGYADGDVLDGGAGNDRLDGGTGDDALSGGDGDDRLTGSDGVDTLSGGTGDDQVGGGTGDDQAAGDLGDDRVTGDDGTDVIDGGAGVDSVDGGDEDDTVLGGTENDRLWGGEGNDNVDAGPGDDELHGDDGADRVAGADGNDRLYGGGDDDVLDGGWGADTLAGDDGNDAVDYGMRVAPLAITLDNQAGDGEAGEGDDVRDSVDVVIGGAAGDVITGSRYDDELYGEGGDDQLSGGDGEDKVTGGDGADRIAGGDGTDAMDGGTGRDTIDAIDGTAEQIFCGLGRDVARADKADRPDQCETVRNGAGANPGNGAPNTIVAKPRKAKRVAGIRKRVGGGKFVAIPGFPGEMIDRRLLADVAYLVRKYHVRVTDGYAREGHAAGGEHPRGLAVDLVPGPGGSWNDVDRLAKWAEPRQNRPRSPWRWVGYNGDYNHGRGNHLHLSWLHSATPAGKPARVVWTLRLKAKAARKRTAPSGPARLASLAARSNFSLGRKPSVNARLSSPSRCSGTAQLWPVWKKAGAAFGIRPSVLAGITEVESALGCNMGPSSAGAIGWTQFMPATWKMWGMDASGDGKADPYNGVDAIFSTARYLRASGAPRNYRKALYAYNHAGWYVNLVLKTAKKYR